MFSLRYIILVIGFLLVSVHAAPQAVVRTIVVPRSTRIPTLFLHEEASAIELKDITGKPTSVKNVYQLEGTGKYDPDPKNKKPKVWRKVPKGGYSPSDLLIKVGKI
ncbi:hypothetical protein BT96DRAFT_316770 [Gymnopus androsaceus JB14]|uniref:Uncharacterized protein n=1 Tax=Gymnopus androsaceus JB14 TaxID=1447944 RepID=A0A6A4I9L1_9AGAR|nr:hypothetical protein BT96DRAFT_316770 [Gymnopus androsaceus JB14]